MLKKHKKQYFDTSIYEGKYVVVNTSMMGSFLLHKDENCRNNGYRVVCRKLIDNKVSDVEIMFYQSGPFSSLILPKDISLIKHVNLKAITKDKEKTKKGNMLNIGDVINIKEGMKVYINKTLHNKIVREDIKIGDIYSLEEIDEKLGSKTKTIDTKDFIGKYVITDILGKCYLCNEASEDTVYLSSYYVICKKIIDNEITDKEIGFYQISSEDSDIVIKPNKIRPIRHVEINYEIV